MPQHDTPNRQWESYVRRGTLDKHSLGSVVVGQYPNGRPIFDTTRTEIGEALFQLKYRNDYSQVKPLAKAVERQIVPLLGEIGLVIPAPASTVRARQPVSELASEVAHRIGVPCFNNLVVKSALVANAGSLKNLTTKEEKVDALAGRFVLNKTITNEGRWNTLVVDDLYHTGATLEAVCATLAGYDKIGDIYVAALTWRKP
ncbi:ComF family protein [uncultured Tateyamaria sp.]|nr:ComF family protein [uncultured Tateyamaria sp.]